MTGPRPPHCRRPEVDIGGNRKNDIMLQVLRTSGVEVYPGALALVKALRGQGTPIAVASASENAHAALQAAGIAELLDDASAPG